MSDTDIFISYSRDDREIARRFASALESEGFRVWWDAALHSGETFDEVIEEQLRAARAVVVLWSPRSVKSRWVRAEATLADRRNKLVPAIIEPCDRPIIFELAHTIDLSHWSGDREDSAWQRFGSDLARLVRRSANGKAPSVEPAAEPAPPPASEALAAVAAEDDGDDYEPTEFVTSASSKSARHWLLLPGADAPEMQYVIGPLGLKIGRGQSSDVVLADSQISRAHCLVRLKEDQLHVVDLNSTNGTFVDDERIDEETILPVGSTLRVGSISLVHQVREPQNG
ncbi:MAG TPA: TIR domain-containing protein [Croceibacterium sp.]|nr:TIR domain-containing protein [Croceibacterium sp.]